MIDNYLFKDCAECTTLNHVPPPLSETPDYSELTAELLVTNYLENNDEHV